MSSNMGSSPQLTVKGTGADSVAAPTIHGTGPEPPESGPMPVPGTRIGQYEIIRELGRGGMGAVYAARDTKLGRKVAIKFLNSQNQPEITARFILEARATARCSHENIIVIGCGSSATAETRSISLG